MDSYKNVSESGKMDVLSNANPLSECIGMANLLKNLD